MGSFFGSIHLRTDDRAAVQSAAAAVARRRAKFYLAPPRRGWVTLYLSDAGQDDRVAASVAKAVGGWAVWVSLHDDDVFAYAVWRDGRIVDRFNSCPDYFGAEVSPAARRRVAGDPSTFADLLPPGVGPGEVKAGLSDDGSAFAAASQLANFARALGLPGAETSYDYLAAGETEDVEGWPAFTHVPDQSREQARRRKQADAALDRRRQWRDAGVLLAEASRRSAGRFQPAPITCPDQAGGGFLAAWSGHGMAAPAATALEHFSPPWSAGPAAAGIELTTQAHALAASPCGRFLAVGYAGGRWAAELWAWPERRRVGGVAVGRAVEAMAFSPDGGRLYLLSQGEVAAADTADAAVQWQTEVGRNVRSMVAHPTEPLLVCDFGMGGLTILNAATGTVVRRLAPGEDAYRRQAELQTRLMAYVGGDSDETLAAWQAALQTVGAAIRQGEVISGLRFTADGRFLLAATAGGVRAFDWPAVHDAAEEVPPPQWSADALAFTLTFRGHAMPRIGPTYCVAESPADGQILFGEACGALRSLDPRTGEVRTLLQLPEGGPIWSIHASRDGSLLAMIYRATHDDGMNPTPAELLVWSLAELAADAASAKED